MTFLIEMGIVAAFLILAATQVIFPIFGYGRFFALFRSPEKRLSKIEADIEEIKLNKIVEEKEKAKRAMETGGETKNGTTTEGEGENVSDNKENNLG